MHYKNDISEELRNVYLLFQTSVEVVALRKNVETIQTELQGTRIFLGSILTQLYYLYEKCIGSCFAFEKYFEDTLIGQNRGVRLQLSVSRQDIWPIRSSLKYTFSERLINADFESVVCFYKIWLGFESELALSKTTRIFSEVYFSAPLVTHV